MHQLILYNTLLLTLKVNNKLLREAIQIQNFQYQSLETKRNRAAHPQTAANNYKVVSIKDNVSQPP